MDYPKVIISEQGASFLRKGQVWMYANNLVNTDNEIEDGSIVKIETEEGEYLGTGFYAKDSHIKVRILTHQADAVIDRAFFEKRVLEALDFRKTVEPNNLACCRLLFGEADGLPGLTADRYDNIVVTQITCTGMEQRKEMLYDILMDACNDVDAIYERNDVHARSSEGLPLYKGFYTKTDLIPAAVINENGIFMNVDIENGQKTGYFLDQKSNRVLLRNISKGKKVLDCFTHTGGFALNAAKGEALSVTAVDVSASALEEGKKNAELNHFNQISFVQADVFDYLDTLQTGQFDIIVLDPPAFTKDRRTVMKAYNGYKRINMQAMKALSNNGYLITCSCSRYMEMELFEKMLKESALEAGVVLKQISVTQQNADHPILWTMSETSYLKFYIFQICSDL